MSTIKKFEGHWLEAKKEIDRQVERVWLSEPDEIQKIRWGIIDSGAGSGQQSFSVLVHLEAYLMLVGADVMYRFLKVSQYPDVELPTLIKMTREFLTGTFNVFEFMTDLGLTNMHEVGQMYSDALDQLETKDEYVQLTGSMMTYVIRMHRWIHFIFPWNLGVAFPHRKPQEVAAISAVLCNA
ncbi:MULTISPECIES: hypothetical protein [Paraburkholderia]|jgi:hypothetical protein|uniref:cucumopine synthase-related protein n=1 Tax=Paraburkholderia TaxID=1822464 RepID=UPI001914AAAD|nr:MULTISPECIES: hypothetical protein [Paraburkholderia]MBK5051661.1 hypothetical protein [Burkholderia sp. R-70006]MBK5185199.1 hypothetical protein [Burkholderia sp. R-69749]MCI0151660.1 hypothetical protein [Paraburkholderia sediminicola]CAE6790174.1 hypothetical protein R70006_04810 [Paraburkholderia domus]CAE6794167.1 hypothetical protein R75483_05032 [Paraburkholderia domus]